MSMVKEVADAIEVVADGIGNVRKIYEAVRDGKRYLEEKHPEVRKNVAEMCGELRKTMQAIASASSIVTHFSFNVSDQAIATEPTRFNDYLMQYKTQALGVESQINALRGHCSIIKQHAEKLQEAAAGQSFGSFLELFGLRSKKRERELGEAIQRVYNEEEQFHTNALQMYWALNGALDDVASKLGPPGMMDAKNVPIAAATLGEYAERFRRLEADANYMGLQIQTLVDELTKA